MPPSILPSLRTPAKAVQGDSYATKHHVIPLLARGISPVSHRRAAKKQEKASQKTDKQQIDIRNSESQSLNELEQDDIQNEGKNDDIEENVYSLDEEMYVDDIQNERKKDDTEEKVYSLDEEIDVNGGVEEFEEEKSDIITDEIVDDEIPDEALQKNDIDKTAKSPEPKKTQNVFWTEKENKNTQKQPDAQTQERIEGAISLRFSILFEGGISVSSSSDISGDGTISTMAMQNTEITSSEPEQTTIYSVLEALVWALCESPKMTEFEIIGGPCGDSLYPERNKSISIVAPYLGGGMSLSLKNEQMEVMLDSADYGELYESKDFQGEVSLRWTAWDVMMPILAVKDPVTSDEAERDAIAEAEAFAAGTRVEPRNASNFRADALSASLWTIERSASKILRSQIESGSFDSILRASDGRIWASSPRHLEQEFFIRFLMSPTAEEVGLTPKSGPSSDPITKKQIIGMHPTMFAVVVLMLVLGLLVSFLVVRPRRNNGKVVSY